MDHLLKPLNYGVCRRASAFIDVNVNPRTEGLRASLLTIQPPAFISLHGCPSTSATYLSTRQMCKNHMFFHTNFEDSSFLGLGASQFNVAKLQLSRRRSRLRWRRWPLEIAKSTTFRFLSLLRFVVSQNDDLFSMRISALGPENRLFATIGCIFRVGPQPGKKFIHGILGNERIVYSMSFLWNITILVDINFKFQLSISLTKVLPWAFGRSTQIFLQNTCFTLAVFDSCVASLSASLKVAVASKRKACLQCPERSQALIAAQQLITFLENTVSSCVASFGQHIFWKTKIQKVSILYWGRDKSNPCTHPGFQLTILPSIGCNCSCTISSSTFSAALRQKPFSQALMTALQVITSNWSEVQFITWWKKGCKMCATKVHEFSKLQNELFLVWAFRLWKLFVFSICIGFFEPQNSVLGLESSTFCSDCVPIASNKLNARCHSPAFSQELMAAL